LQKQRYNQAAVLGQPLARFSGHPRALEPKRPPPQPRRDEIRKGAAKDVLGVFRVPGAKLAAVKGVNILLVDDLFTMGVTPSACAGL
jgi:predicted amidophosphoribosyltransferase